MITATARIPIVTKRKDTFHVLHGFADAVASSHDVATNRTAARMGFHRALRVAGCKEGGRVSLAGTEISWHYPSAEYEARNWPSGFGKWNSTIDGISGLKTLQTRDPIFALPVSEISARSETLVPGIVRILLN